MNWWVKLFVPKHEQPLLERGMECKNVWVSNNGQYTFLDKHGNGFTFYTFNDHVSHLAFLVDGTAIEDGESYPMSDALKSVLTDIGDKAQAKRIKARDEETKERFIKAIHMYGARRTSEK